MRITTLFFDLDDTLYPPRSGLWEAIRERMNEYMMQLLRLPREQVTVIRQSYLDTYGTTLRGLQHHYQVNADDYLAFVHDLPLEKYIQPDPRLRKLLLSLPQRRLVFTNADANHARRVMGILGVEGCFESIIDIRAVHFACKPEHEAYQRALHIAGMDDPRACLIFDDSERNLAPARSMGFFTVLVSPDQTNHQADLTITSLHDIPRALPELWDG